LTIRPKLEAGVPDNLDSRDDVWSNAPVLKSTANQAAKTGSNENTPQLPAWLASRNRPAQPGPAANMNGREATAAAADGASAGAGRDWLYDWDAPLSRGAVQEKRRRRLFLPGNAIGTKVGKGRLVVHRLAVSAACLAIVAAIGGGVLLFSGHSARQPVATVAQIQKKKAPAIAGNDAAAKAQDTKQVARAAETGTAQTAAVAAKTPAGVNEAQKVAALPAGSAAGKPAAKLPSSDSARWASNVVLPGKALSGALAGKPVPATRSMAAYAPLADDAKPGAGVKAAPQGPAAPEVKPAQEAKPAPEVKAASLAPEPKADDAETSSIPNDRNAAEKARGTMEDVAHSRAKLISTGGSHAAVTTAVNLRAGQDNHSRVLTVVPAGASVELFGCSQWCKIAYDGHEGFVYKDFVKHSGHAPAVAGRHEKAAGKVASSGAGNKLIGGVVVDDGGSKAAVASEPAAAVPAAPKPAQPAAAEPATMQHQAR
jgi:hypothetical protein